MERACETDSITTQWYVSTQRRSELEIFRHVNILRSSQVLEILIVPASILLRKSNLDHIGYLQSPIVD